MTLFDLGADLATPINGKRAGERLRIAESQVTALESAIDLHNAALAPLKVFRAARRESCLGLSTSPAL